MTSIPNFGSFNDRNGTLGRLTTQMRLNAWNNPIHNYAGRLRPGGNRLSRTTSGDPSTRRYADAYRLIRQQKSGQRATFVYDDNSNLTTKWHQGGSPRTIVYDAADRITTYQEGSALTTLAWQSRGAMHTQKTGTDTTTFTYSDPMFLTAVDGPSGRLGSEVATLDSGGLVDQFEYRPYGERVDDLPEGAPVFLCVGGLGYGFDTDDRRYVRHRILRTDFGLCILKCKDATRGFVECGFREAM